MSLCYVNCPSCNFQFSFENSSDSDTHLLTCSKCGKVFAIFVEPVPSMMLNPEIFYKYELPITDTSES